MSQPIKKPVPVMVDPIADSRSVIRELKYRLNHHQGKEAYAASRSHYERLLEQEQSKLVQLMKNNGV